MTQPPQGPAPEPPGRHPLFDLEREDRERAALDAVVGPRPDDDTPLWEMHPYWGLPHSATDDAIRARLWHVDPDEVLGPDEPLFPSRPGDGLLLRRGARAYVVYRDGEAVASHSGERLFVAAPCRRQGIGLALARALMQEQWWKIAVRHTWASIRVHQRAYRHVILDAMLRGDAIHPAILEVLALIGDGTAVDFTPEGPRVR